MAGLLRSYVHYVHRRYGLVGHLWQGRFKSAAVEAEAYFLSCARSIERNPLTAGLVGEPAKTKKNKKEQITWRSFWNGGSTSGTISRTWNVHDWPTLYIMDAKGVIRYKYLGFPGTKVVDEAIEVLMKENDKQATKSAP